MNLTDSHNVSWNPILTLYFVSCICVRFIQTEVFEGVPSWAQNTISFCIEFWLCVFDNIINTFRIMCVFILQVQNLHYISTFKMYFCFAYSISKMHVILNQNINVFLFLILFLCRIYFLNRLLILHTLNLSVAIWNFHSVATFANFDVQQSALCSVSVCLWCLSAVNFAGHAQKSNSSFVTTTKPKER